MSLNVWISASPTTVRPGESVTLSATGPDLATTGSYTWWERAPERPDRGSGCFRRGSSTHPRSTFLVDPDEYVAGTYVYYVDMGPRVSANAVTVTVVGPRSTTAATPTNGTTGGS